MWSQAGPADLIPNKRGELSGSQYPQDCLCYSAFHCLNCCVACCCQPFVPRTHNPPGLLASLSYQIASARPSQQRSASRSITSSGRCIAIGAREHQCISASVLRLLSRAKWTSDVRTFLPSSSFPGPAFDCCLRSCARPTILQMHARRRS